jgi:hypothetical protein
VCLVLDVQGKPQISYATLLRETFPGNVSLKSVSVADGEICGPLKVRFATNTAAFA